MIMFSIEINNNNKLPLRFIKYIMKNSIVLKYKFPQLYKILGIYEMKKELLIEKFINKYMNMSSNDNNDKINKEIGCYQFQYDMINYLINNWYYLSSQNNNLQILLKKIPLIPIINYEKLLIAPSELYDPSILIFKKLFNDEPVFPQSYFLKIV